MTHQMNDPRPLSVSAEWIPLRAGPLTMHFDPATLSLRYLCFGEREVVRRIYAAVRDRNWGTVAPQLSNLQVQPATDSFRIEFEARCVEGEIDFVWNGTLIGHADGSVQFIFDGLARTSFLRARIGLCVLHPLVGCAGEPCLVEHVEGSREESSFPKLVSPHQPFFNVRALTHEVCPGVTAEVRLEGDIFETEDQRNWTDASFKTYSTPLALPFPVRISAGTRIRQEVRVRLQGASLGLTESGRTRPGDIARSTVTFDFKAPGVRPPIGLCLPDNAEPLTPGLIARLQSLQLPHLRVDLPLADPNWPSKLHSADRVARQIGTGLHAAIHLSDDPERELKSFLQELGTSRPPIQLLLVFHVREKSTSDRRVQLVLELLKQFDLSLPVAAGTDAYFAELNRQHLSLNCPVLPCYSLNPQVHASDEASLLENICGQLDTVETAWAFASKPVVVSPITLRPRFNPNATASADTSSAGQLPPEVDPRQLSLFCAAWTLGSIAQLTSTAHAHSLTYYETMGWRGIMESPTGSPLPDRFPSQPDTVFPVYHLFADLAGYDRVYPVRCSDPLAVAGLGLASAKGRSSRLLITNLRNHLQRIRIHCPSIEAALTILDSTSAEEATHAPERFRARPGQRVAAAGGLIELELSPFAIARLDCP
jgi:D-apionolactonase